MKGLLLKDFYLAKKYCKGYLFIAAIFLCIAWLGKGGMFFFLYPCLLASMLPVSLYAYDEKSRWVEYSGSLPYSRAQIVSGKYVVASLTMLFLLAAAVVMHVVRLLRGGADDLGEFPASLGGILFVSCLSVAFSLPPIFKWGAEKGRVVYLLLVVLLCGGFATFFALANETELFRSLSLNRLMLILCPIGVALYALSWVISVWLYEKRDF